MGVIKKQGIANTLITYAGIIIGFANLIFIQPYFLEPEELGLTRVLYAFSALIAMFLPLGIGNVTLKYFPYFRDKEGGHQGMFMLNMLFLFIGFLMIGLLMLLLKNWIVSQYIEESPLFTEYFYCTFPLSVFVALNALLSIYCQSLFKSSFPAFVNDILSRLLTIVWVSMYYLKWISFDVFIYGFVAQYLLQALILVAYIHVIDKPGYRINWKFVRSNNPRAMLKYGFLLAFTSFASLGIKFIDMVLLGHFMPLEKVSVYAVAVFVPMIIEAPLTALEKISNAKIAHEWAQGNLTEIQKIYKQSVRYLALIGGFLFLCVNLNAAFLFELLPKDFSGGLNVVLIVSIGTFFNMVTGLNGSILFSSPSYMYGSYMLFLLLILAFVNCLLLIPPFGIEGAAAAIAIASFVYNLLKYLFIWKRFSMQPFDRQTLLILLLIACTYFLVWLIPALGNPFADIAVRSFLVLIIYGFGTYMLNIIPEFHHLLPWERKEKRS